jgi:ppGpp synthetase/RelA/SpoT-type nucleotidyltranferase
MKPRRQSPLRGLPDRPGSLNQLKRLGNAIRDDDAQAIRGVHYDDVFGWYNDLVVAAIEDLEGAPLKSCLSNPDTLTITGRAKTRITVREKLRRRHSEKLPSIQDLAGIRIEANMTLSEQDAIANALSEWFGQPAESVHDLRDGTHAGYRAVHLWVRLKQPRGAWFEIQVRTVLQGEWANYFEALADYLGRDLRYGMLPVHADLAEQVMAAQGLSRVSITEFERLYDLPRTPPDSRGDQDAATDSLPAVLAFARKSLSNSAERLRSMIQEGGPQNVELRREV